MQEGQTYKGALQEGMRPLRCFHSAAGEEQGAQAAATAEESPLPLTVYNAQDMAACLEACRDVPTFHTANPNGQERAGHRRGKQQPCFRKSKSLESALFTLEDAFQPPHSPTSGLSLSLNSLTLNPC